MTGLSSDNPLFALKDARPAPLLQARLPEMEAAAEFLNEAARGLPPFRHLPDRVRRHEIIMAEPLASAGPAEAPEVAGRDREWWSRTAGSALEDPYLILYGSGSMGRSRSLLPSSVLIEIFEQLLAARQRSTDTWLFRYEPIWWQPAAGERAALENLERRAGSVTRQNRAEFLSAVDDAGLFSPIFRDDRARVLHEWQFGQLTRWAETGRALLDYLESWPRMRRIPSRFRTADPNQSPVDIAVFLDGETPWPPAERDAWLADLEAALADAPAGAGSGEIIGESQGRPFRLGWRRNDTRTVLEWIRNA
jgi:hypothetical protein